MNRELWALRTISITYYIGFLIGFIWTRPPLFATFTFVVKVAMALFLLYRFNMFTDYKKFTQVDREIVLFAAGFILVSSFTDYINQFVEVIRDMFKYLSQLH